MKGRRVEGLDDLEEPGDYAGPFTGYSGPDKTAVFFLLPIARDPDAPPPARSVHHVTSPPHTFRECADGSLEIRASIGARWAPGEAPDGNEGFYWHGYLDEGHEWRVC